jgi:hypothetical protein
MGARDGMRPLSELLDESSYIKDVLVTLKPTITITNWSLHSGSAYVAPFTFLQDDIRVDVLEVKTTLDFGPLTRVETIADCISTAGTFYFDPQDETAQDAVWDDEVNLWDDNILKWDQFPRLYVHTTDGEDPSTGTVVAVLGLYYATRAQSHPTLGDDLLSGSGDFESWTDQNPDGWTTSEGAASVEEETTDVIKNSSSCKFEWEGDEPGPATESYIQFALTNMVVGGTYRIHGYYKTKVTADMTNSITLFDSSEVSLVDEDGRNLKTSGNTVSLSETYEEWRTFVVDFIAWETSHILRIKSETSDLTNGETGHMLLDDVQVRRVWRYNHYLPRVSSTSIPTVRTGSNDIFFGGKQISIGSITLNNGDGMFDKLIPRCEWINQEVLIDHGGEFQDGQELMIEHFERAMTGLIQGIDNNDINTTFEIQDKRTFFHILLPEDIHDDQDEADLDLRFQGQPRPVFFGVKENIRPVRVDYDPTYDKYGVYEVCNCDDAPNGIKAVDKVYIYVDETAADEKRSDLRIELTESLNYDVDLSTGRVTIKQDVGPFIIEAGVNDHINFNENIGGSGTEFTAVLDAGLYTAQDLAVEVETKMQAASTSDEYCDYDESTNKFTLHHEHPGSGLTLLLKTGSNKDRSAYKTLGFTGTDDQAGTTSHTSDEAVFTDADTGNAVRVDAQGYKDDASGTYTGIASSLIEIGADICKFVFNRLMDYSLDDVDTTTFTESRSNGAQSLTLYINEETSTKQIFDRLEFSNIANITIDGSGVIYYEVYIGTVPSNIVHVFDEDITNFSVSRSARDVYSTIRVRYDRDPTLGIFKERKASDASVPIRLGRPDIKTFETYLKSGSNARSVASRMLELSKFAARKVSVGVRGSKCLKLRVGQKIKITRRRAMDRSGELDGDVFRIISIERDMLSGRAQVECTDDRVTVATTACITTCQAFCETTCQGVCEQACQETCKLGCQDSCEASCQGTCQTDCQNECELACKTTCELNCQTACKLACQGGCEGGGCQTICEDVCQTACELQCQTACETGCQVICRLECQIGCEVACQTTCETGCQGACKLACKLTCEVNCQTGCEFTCESVCEAGCKLVDEQ